MSADVEAVERSAIDFGDDDVLSDIDETTGEVTRSSPSSVRCRPSLYERRAWTRSTEGRSDLRGSSQTIGVSMISPDGFAINRAYPPTDGSEALNPLRAGVRHHEDGVECRAGHRGFFRSPGVSRLPANRSGERLNNNVHHRGCDLLRRLRPNIDDLVVTLAVGNETFDVLVLDFVNLNVSSSRAIPSSSLGISCLGQRWRYPLSLLA